MWSGWKIDHLPDSNQMNLRKNGLFLTSISCLVPSGNCSTSNLGKINPLDYPMPYTWSPDGKYIVVAGRWDLSASREGIGLDFIDIQTRQVQRSIEIPGFNWARCLSLAWSPDGKWIAFDQEDGIYKVPVEGGTRFWLHMYHLRLSSMDEISDPVEC